MSLLPLRPAAGLRLRRNHNTPRLPSRLPSTHTPVKQTCALVPRWSALLDERPWRQGTGLLGSAWVDGRRDGSHPPAITRRSRAGTAARSRCRSAPAGGILPRQRRSPAATSSRGPPLGVGQPLSQTVPKWPDLTALMNEAKAAASNVRTGPSGSLLSRTGTTPGRLSEISTQSFCAPEKEDFRH